MDYIPLAAPLAQLEGADLIRRIRELETAYQFKHNLIQESAYSSLLRNDRRALHRACAQAIETSFPQNLDDNAALLAQHYDEAGDEPKAFEYALRAGDAALRMHALAEALDQYDSALARIERLPLATNELLHVYQKRGRVLELMGRYTEAVTTYQELEALGKARGEAALEIGALLSLGTLYTFPNPAQDLAKAQRVNTMVLDRARELHDEESQARALWNLQQHAYFVGMPTESVAFSKEALEIADRLGMDELRAYILNDASRSLVTVESVPAALEALAQARALWRKSGNLPMLADNLSSTAESAHWIGNLEMAEEFIQETQTLSQTIGNLWNLAYSSGILMQIYVGRGETKRALEIGAQTYRFAKQSGFLMAGFIAEIQRATIYGELGVPERGLEVLNTIPKNESFLFFESWRVGNIALLELTRQNLPAVRTAIETIQKYGASQDLSSYGPMYILLCSARLAILEKRYADAIQETDIMIARLQKVQIRVFLPDFFLVQATAHFALNDRDTAIAELEQAEQLARKMQARPRLWQILAQRADIESQNGNTARADEYRREAETVIHQLAELAPQELRETFLALPTVQAVLNA